MAKVTLLLILFCLFGILFEQWRTRNSRALVPLIAASCTPGSKQTVMSKQPHEQDCVDLEHLLAHDPAFAAEVQALFAPLLAKVDALIHPECIPLLPERCESYQEARERVIETYSPDGNGELLQRRELLDRAAFEQGMYRGWTRTK